MGYTGMKKDEKSFRIIRYAMVILPAAALGIVAMVCSGVSAARWGQQAAAVLVFALLGIVPKRIARRIPAGLWTVFLLLCLAATLLGAEAGGARRWLDLGVFNVHAAMLVLPAMIILLANVRCFFPLMLCIAIILSMQPDLSQLLAFAAAVLPLLWRSRDKRVWGMLSVLVLAALVMICIHIPTSIEPVPYSEGVLAMLGEVSWLMAAAGMLSLAMIPVLWIYRFSKEREVWMLSLGVYYMIIILFGLSGEYPVPFVGFGLSPIAGYWLAYWFMPLKQNGK